LEEVELTYRRILSPINGIIGRIHRFKGEYIEDGNTILSLHNPNIYWIEAYVDESQIRHVARGKSVLIDFESYPFEDFYGKVEYVGNLTTAQTGVKTNSSKSSFSSGVERVPVRISISNPPPNLTPGMRASVNIRIYENIKLW
jgi:membrane fusion protein (multidrug efflux system)